MKTKKPIKEFKEAVKINKRLIKDFFYCTVDLIKGMIIFALISILIDYKKEAFKEFLIKWIDAVFIISPIIIGLCIYVIIALVITMIIDYTILKTKQENNKKNN